MMNLITNKINRQSLSNIIKIPKKEKIKDIFDV